MSPDQPSRCRPASLLHRATHAQTMMLVITLLLGACTPQRPELAAPAVSGGRPDLTLPRTPSIDASLPTASSVFSAPMAVAGVAAAAPAASAAPQARANNDMTPAQESLAMPMAGQANDHSVPVIPPKAAASR